MASEPQLDLADDAIVVRGGLMESATLATNIAKHAVFFPDDPPSLSVGAHPEWTATEIVVAAAFIPNAQVRVSTVGAIRALGHDVVPQGRIPHANLRLSANPSEDVYDELRSVFSEPIRKEDIPDD